MSDFESLYAVKASPPIMRAKVNPSLMEEVRKPIQENLSEVMGDSTLNAQGENLASENCRTNLCHQVRTC